MSNKAVLTLDDKSFELPVIEGVEGEKAVDISTLRNQSGYITFDEGYGKTGSCQSDITFIDGENGILRYRGYPIEELAGKSTFLEGAYLIMNGELPTDAQLKQFNHDVESQAGRRG